MPPVQRARRTAFTLAELLVVLGMMAVLACVALPTAARARDARATRAAIREAAEAMALARDEALARRTMSTAQVDTATGTITVRANGRQVGRFTLGANHGVSLSVTRDSVAFDARGLGYGPANLTLVARRARAADTLVMSRLGRVRY